MNFFQPTRSYSNLCETACSLHIKRDILLLNIQRLENLENYEKHSVVIDWFVTGVYPDINSTMGSANEGVKKCTKMTGFEIKG